MIRLVLAVRLVAALLACTVSATLAQGPRSITRKAYTLEFRDAPGNGAWQALTDIPAQNQAHEVLAVDQPLPNVVRRFYRAVTLAE